MSDNLANLRNYKIQLQQVEMSLINEPDNEDLKTLQNDLNEVIQLTLQLMSKEELAALESLENDVQPRHNFRAGDMVLAPWSEDGQFYEAQVEDITSDGQCTVIFSHTKKRLAEVCLVGLLKPLGKKSRSHHYSSSNTNNNNKSNNSSTAHKKTFIDAGSGYSSSAILSAGPTTNAGIAAASSFMKSSSGPSSSSTSSFTNNQYKNQQELREAQRRKQQKRKDKLKQLEEEREKDKMRWQSFSSKINKKTKGGQKKSIFASPDTVSGRVGVGTCGVGGRPMTEYQQQKLETVPRNKASTALPKLSLSNPY